MNWIYWHSHCRFGPKWPVRTLLAITLVQGLVIVDVTADCVVRENALGNQEYRCDNGSSGELRKDPLGRWQDLESGVTYRETPMGNIESSDGSTYRKDPLGRYRSEDGGVWRQDGLGRWHSSGHHGRTE